MNTWDIGIGLLVAGYALRLASRTDLNNLPFYSTQYALFIFAPVFIMAGVYNQLSRLVLVFGTLFAYFRPRFYTVFFFCWDVVSLILQAAGGGMSADTSSANYQTRMDIIIGGIAFQCLSMALFLFCLLWFCWKIYKASPSEYDPQHAHIRSTPGFKLFIPAVIGCWVFVMFRSIFRLVELGEGWGGNLMAKEVPFFILEGLMILAIACLTLVHPGYFFSPKRFERTHLGPYSDELSSKALIL